MKSRWMTHHLPLLLWLLLIYTLSDIPTLHVQALGFADFVLRKVAHFTEYGILAVLIRRLADRQPKKLIFYLISFFLAVLYAISDEWHQIMIPGRVGSASDVLIDSLGATTGLIIWFLRGCRRIRKRHEI